jgi:subtilisin family serine protease
VAGSVTVSAGVQYTFVLFSTTQVLVVPTPTPTPTATPTATPTPSSTPTPTPTPTSTAVASGPFACPATGTAGTGSFARFGFGEAIARRPEMRRLPDANAPVTLAVTYDRSAALANSALLQAREQQLGARLVRSFDYDRQNIVMRVLAVPAGSLAQVESTLRAQNGVRSVELSGQRRSALTSTSPYYSADPYFDGFTAGQTGTVSTFETTYGETASIPGQWDMHVIGLERAFGYVNGGTGVAATGNALGSTSIKIAIIDTGEDASHPELTSKIAYQHCYITNLSNVQSTGSFSTDELGHGTDVSGIAAAASNNKLGFTGVGGKAVIYAYRVFPTPDDNCAIEGTSDAQCSADTTDIASAIDDAVTQGVNVISMSLGGGSCSGGVDSDPDERAAIANALSHNVIVVAAAGNSGTASLDAPACISGVIAVGATGLDDGTTTGTTSYSKSVAGASASTPVEYVAAYSQYVAGGPNNNVHQATSWGIVAPGGDPSNSEVSGTPDDLHWIENIWTSTPYQSSPSDTAFTGNCNGDYPAETGTADCRTLIAGTSMATPHVAGAVALILAVNSSYQTPAAMKQLLCQTADDLHDTHQGCGRLNVYRAMATALGDTSPP